ncbi:hypothetical protein C8R47DRAFT_934066, partial [Mycena vitilis]
RLNSFKYPVLTLPNEITSAIFIRFLPPYPVFPPFTGVHSPTVLTYICWQWRDISLSLPALWSFISSYDDDLAHHGPEDSEPPMLRLWLERSRPYPLYLRLGKHEWADDTLVQAFISHRARWESLEL